MIHGSIVIMLLCESRLVMEKLVGYLTLDFISQMNLLKANAIFQILQFTSYQTRLKRRSVFSNNYSLSEVLTHGSDSLKCNDIA